MKLETKCKVVFDSEKVHKKMQAATFTTLNQAGGAIRLIAKRSIKKGNKKKPSSPGTPPHTLTKALPNSILYAVGRDKTYVVIGPASNLISDVGAAHEFGGQYRKQRYPARPFMGPALIKGTPRLPENWAASFR